MSDLLKSMLEPMDDFSEDDMIRIMNENFDEMFRKNDLYNNELKARSKPKKELIV